jgi:hypothetical protein
MKYSSAVTALTYIRPEQVVVLMLMMLVNLHGTQKRTMQAEIKPKSHLKMNSIR